jgi:Putative prokaryotic signal transducing protein
VDEEIVCLAMAANATEAHQWLSALEESGIKASVVDHLEAEFWMGASPRAEVWVRQADLERAGKVLEHHHAGRPPEEGDAIHPRRRPTDEHGEAAQRDLHRQGADGVPHRPEARGK